MNLPPLPKFPHDWHLLSVDEVRTYAEQYGRLCAEAERKRLMDGAREAIQSDTENGVKWLNIIEAERFRSQFPALNAWLAKENT